MSKTISNPQTVLRPQDVVVLLRLSLDAGSVPTYAALAEELKLTASEIHAGIDRAMTAQLARKDESGKPVLLLEALRLFVQHGVRYCFPATHGPMGRGMPTAHAAAPLNKLMVQSLYELLALVDAVRGGGMRERALAIAELDKRWAS